MGMKFLTKRPELVFRNDLSDILHKLQIEIKVVDRVQAQRQNLFGQVEMPEVGPAVMAAGIA